MRTYKRRTKKWVREHTSITLKDDNTIVVTNNLELHTRKMLSRVATNILRMRLACAHFSPQAKRIMSREITDRMLIRKVLLELLD